MSKKNIKIISLLLSLIIMVSLITFKNIRVNADISDMPTFEVKIDSVNPNPALVGEDITVNGTITPKPFETTVPAKEIVLVLDVSNSMNEYIKGTTSVRRIDALKEAAKNFINKMKSVPNLKIGIVTYGTNAEIKKSKINGVNNFLINASNSEKLKEIINNINISGGRDGGTNTGDGLRQASYLLSNSTEADKNANKTIVLMSDGMPTYRVSNYEWKANGYYGYYKNELNYYTKITIEGYEDAEVFGTGNSDKDLKNTNYAMDIGKIINKKGYNVFSVGYGLSNTIESGEILSSLDKNKLIHASMIGANIINNKINDGTIINKENGFYETSEGAIDGVFQQIADKIINSYPINNITMNFNFTENFILNIGGNTVNVGNINYKKVSENNGKVRYEANSIPFEFVIRANKDGQLKIFDKITINYPWQNNIEKLDILRDLSIKILSNEEPNILVNLISEKEMKANRNDEITIEYEIEPVEFTSSTLNIESKKVEEAIFITDLSKDMKSGNRFSQLKGAIENKVLGNSQINPIKFGAVGYGDDSISVGDIGNTGIGTVKSIDNVDNLIHPLMNINNQNEKEEFRKLFQNDMFGNVLKDTDIRNVDKALKMAKDILNKFGTPGKRKAIILLSSGSVNYSKDIVQEIKQEGYKVISLDLSGTTNTNLKNFHVDLGGRINNIESDTDFLISKSDGGNFNFINNDMENVAKRLISGTMLGEYSPINPKIYFNLKNNFEYVNKSNSDNISLISNEDSKLSFQINQVKYFYSGLIKLGKYRYIAPKQTISFKIKPKSGKTGTLTFAENLEGNDINNYLFYNKFNNNESKNPIDTPIVTIKDEVKNITHGLYNGINNGNLLIQENKESNFEIAKDSTVTFGSKFTVGGNNVTFDLNISDNFNTVNENDIKIYKVKKDFSEGNMLKAIENTDVINKVIERQINNSFKISINNIKENNNDLETEILVVYQARVKSEIQEGVALTNSINFADNEPVYVNITVYNTKNNSPSLPDLF